MPTDLLAALILVAGCTPPDCQPSDVERLPPAVATRATLALVREAKCRAAEPPLSCYRWDDWREYRREVDRRYEVWDWADAARGNQGNNYVRGCYALWRLRELIGEEAYAAGALPNPLPP